MVNKVTFTQPQLIDFIAENVKDIVDSHNQQAQLLYEQGLFGNLFSSGGKITPYKPEEAEKEIEQFNYTITDTQPKDGYDILKMLDEMLLQGIDIKKVLNTLQNLPNWEINKAGPHVTDYFAKNPDMVAKVPKLSSVDIKTLTELLKILEVPFVNKEQGNIFRKWMNKNHPDWRAKDGDVLDPEGSYNNKWISEAWRQYRQEYIKTDSYTPEIPFNVLGATLQCIKKYDSLRKQYGFSKLPNPDPVYEMNAIFQNNQEKLEDIFGKNVHNLEGLSHKERLEIINYIKNSLQTEQVDGRYDWESLDKKGRKKLWKQEVEKLAKTLKTHKSRVKLATILDPGFKLVTKYQQQSTEPGWGYGGLRFLQDSVDGACSALGRWLVEIKFTEEDEYQAQFDELDSDGDGMIQLMPDRSRACMACHAFVGPNARTPNAQERLLMDVSFQSMQVMPEKLYNRLVELKDWFMDGGYHLIIDICAFIAYLTCPFTAGIGCAVSVALDLINAYTYVHFDDDYYHAGMQLAFAVVPGGEGMKYAIKNPAAKKAIGNFFRKVWGKGQLKNALKSAKQEIRALGPAAKKEIQEVFGGAIKYIKKGLEMVIKGLNQIRRGAKNYLPSALYNTLKKMINTTSATFRALVYAIEIFVYDPGLPAQLIEMLAGQNSFSDWLHKLPKIGLKIWSKILETTGSFRGAITTTPYDCTGKVYLWETPEEGMSGDDISIQQEWESAIKMGELNPTNEEFTEENVWAEWEKGWRPENWTNEYILLYWSVIEENEKLMKKYDIYLKDCMTFLQAMESNDVEDRKMLYIIFTELGMTEAEVEDFFQISNPNYKATQATDEN